MNSRIAVIGFVALYFFSFEYGPLAAEKEKPPATAVVQDPRSGPSLTLLFDGQAVPYVHIHHAVLIVATSDFKSGSPNKILGVPKAFSDAQIIHALKKFYSTWKPDERRGQRRPQIILAVENWGAGSTLHEPLSELSKKFKIDVYFYYPVGASFAKTAVHPKPNDKRLADLIEKKPEQKAKQ